MRLTRIVLVLELLSPIWAAQAPVAEPLTVMSFNIRYGTANDGENRWENRRQALFSRERSTELLARRIAARSDRGEPAIVTGDLNVGESNPALTALVGSASAPGPFVDTFRVLYAGAKEVGTFTASRPRQRYNCERCPVHCRSAVCP